MTIEMLEGNGNLMIFMNGKVLFIKVSMYQLKNVSEGHANQMLRRNEIIHYDPSNKGMYQQIRK